MAKIDDRIEAIQQGFQNAQVTFGNTWVEDSQIESLRPKVRRKSAGQTHHKLFYLSIGETGQQATAVFWGHNMTQVLEAAEVWRGTYVKHTKGPRKKADNGEK